MSAPSTSGLSVGLLLRVIDVKYGCLLYFTLYPRSRITRRDPAVVLGTTAGSTQENNKASDRPGNNFSPKKSKATFLTQMVERNV